MGMLYGKGVIRNGNPDGSASCLATPAEIVGKLTLFRTVHLVIAEITRQGLKPADRQAVLAASPTVAQLNASFRVWAAASFDLATALTEADTLTPATNPVAGIPRGTRYLRLIIVTKLLGRWQDAVDKATGGT